jgi:hypothetical protein
MGRAIIRDRADLAGCEDSSCFLDLRHLYRALYKPEGELDEASRRPPKEFERSLSITVGWGIGGMSVLLLSWSAIALIAWFSCLKVPSKISVLSGDDPKGPSCHPRSMLLKGDKPAARYSSGFRCKRWSSIPSFVVYATVDPSCCVM